MAARERVGRLVRQSSAASRLPSILILGETGTGKGLLARSLHSSSPRAGRPFVDVDCPAIPESMLEAELFGFERGAFTGAHRSKPGLLQAAHGGAIFLDEVALLPATLQAKLLQSLEERAVRRLGATRAEPVDVWVLSATNEDLAEAVRAGRFRQDLYHRLAGLPVRLPPLRERGQDILLLAHHYLARACSDHGVPPKRLGPDAEAALLAHPWPGNVRELINVMERVALLVDATVVSAGHLGLGGVAPAPSEAPPAPRGAGFKETRDDFRREQILQALRETEWNVSRAAARLGVARTTLQYGMRKHCLRAERPAAGAGPEGDDGAIHVNGAHGTGAEPPAAPRPDWHTRAVVVLGATWISDDGEGAGAPSTRLLDGLSAKVEAFGGFVTEVGPRGLFAVFGRVGEEDAPCRAASAALALRKMMEGEPFQFRLALHRASGIVQGQDTGMVLGERDGDTLKALVAELLESTPPGAVAASAAAASVLERGFSLEPVTAAAASDALDGRLFLILGREATGTGIGGRRLSPFVGRAREMALLGERLRVSASGRGQVMGIVGEPGVGKSRLLYEFRESLAASGIDYLEARCLSHGGAVPYLPIADVLRREWGIAEDEAPDALAARVRQGVEAAGMESTEATAHLLWLLGVREGAESLAQLSPESVKRRAFETLRSLLLQRSRRRPLVLAVEDLHWIDRSTEEFLTTFVAAVGGARILFLATYRSGYQPPWIERSSVTQLALPPLSPGESRVVVTSILTPAGAPEGIVRGLVARADGNPFHLEELAWAAASGADPASADAVPGTVQETLAARIERLPGPARDVLEAASVLGREVDHRLLAMLMERPAALDAGLRELVRLEFLHERPAAGPPAHVFKHALTQDVAYGRLSEAERRRLHAAAGRALEATYAGRLAQVYDRLAFHYARTDDTVKAVEYLQRFGESAARLYALAEALGAFDEAASQVERLPAGPQRDRQAVQIAIAQATPLIIAGRIEEARDRLVAQAERVERVSEPRLAADYYFFLAHSHDHLADHPAAETYARRALDEARRSGDRLPQGRAHYLLATGCFWTGRHAQGAGHAVEGASLLEGTDEHFYLGVNLWILGHNLAVLGELDRAEEAGRRAEALGGAHDDPRPQCYGLLCRGWVQAMRGEGETALLLCRSGLDLAPDPFAEAVAKGYMGYTHLQRQEATAAEGFLEDAVKSWRAFHMPQLEGWIGAWLAEALPLEGDVGRARAQAGEALRAARAARFPFAIGLALAAQGRIARAGGDLDAAAGRLGESLEVLTSIAARYEAARTRLDLAEVVGARGDRDGARAHLREACRLFETMGLPRWGEESRRRMAGLEGA